MVKLPDKVGRPLERLIMATGLVAIYGLLFFCIAQLAVGGMTTIAREWVWFVFLLGAIPGLLPVLLKALLGQDRLERKLGRKGLMVIYIVMLCGVMVVIVAGVIASVPRIVHVLRDLAGR